MPVAELLGHLGGEIQDTDEEVFELFSNHCSSSNLGMLDPHAEMVEVCIAGRDISLHQSPGILTSDRAGGTTGAVVWRVSIPFAEWLSSESNLLFRHGVLNASSIILELGAGVGLVGLAVSPRIGNYILTDQDYTMKLLQRNIETNAEIAASRAKMPKNRKSTRSTALPTAASFPSLQKLCLDWEISDVSDLARLLATRTECGAPSAGVDAVVACDCIFNEALVDPFVQACASICTLRETTRAEPTVCIIAQQLRSPSVFEHWLRCMKRLFRVWRLPTAARENDRPDAAPSRGAEYVAHLATLRRGEDAGDA